MIKFSKSSAHLISLKDYLGANDSVQKDILAIAALYASQPPRKNCKICDKSLAQAKAKFTKLNVEYGFCPSCGHLNGLPDDTDDFVHKVYIADGGESYGADYKSANHDAYWKRVESVYRPKADFFFEVLKANGTDPIQSKFLDLGAGSGHFLAALQKAGATKRQGLEVAESQVRYGNSVIGDGALLHCPMDQIETRIRESKANVASMIGVLEHLQKPRQVLKAICENPNIEWILVSVPTFSVAVFTETVFPRVLSRHLAWGHTHLFTDGSIDHMCEEFQLKRMGEWWFGLDMLDLFRSVSVELEKSHASPEFEQLWGKTFGPLVDELQSVIDRKKLCSEVHLALRKKK